MANTRPVIKPFDSVKDVLVYGHDPVTDKNVRVAVDTSGALQTAGVNITQPLPAGTNHIGTVDISSIASGVESFTPLTGTLQNISGLDVSGQDTLFSSELVYGDEFWIIINGAPFLWGVIAAVSNNTSATLVTSKGDYSLTLTDTIILAKNLVVVNKPLQLDILDNLRVNVIAGSVTVNNTIDTIRTFTDISAGTSTTISSTPIRLTAWTPTNLGGSGSVCYYKFYDKVNATSSDTPLFTYPITTSLNNTLTPIKFYNYTFTPALSVRATGAYDANSNAVPTGRQISNFFIA